MDSQLVYLEIEQVYDLSDVFYRERLLSPKTGITLVLRPRLLCITRFALDVWACRSSQAGSVDIPSESTMEIKRPGLKMPQLPPPSIGWKAATTTYN